MNKEETKLVYTYGTDGKYTGTKTLDYTDRSPISGAWQIPAGCTETEPLEAGEGMELIWNGESWEQQPKPEEPEPSEPAEPTEDKKLQMEAATAKSEIQAMANSLVLCFLTEAPITAIKEQYTAKVAALSDDVALLMPEYYPVWSGYGEEYKRDSRVTYNGVLYKVLQEHTSQTSWAPDAAPSLFAKVLVSDDGTPLPWEQPDSTNPYMTGDRVTYNGKVYESTIDNNVWAPDAYPQGWKQINTEGEE